MQRRGEELEWEQLVFVVVGGGKRACSHADTLRAVLPGGSDAQVRPDLPADTVMYGGEAPTRIGRRPLECRSAIDHIAVGSRGDDSAEAECLRAHRGATLEALRDHVVVAWA